MQHPVEVTGLLGFLRHLCPLGQVGLGKGAADQITGLGVADFLKQATTDNLERLLWRHGFPESLHPVEDRLQSLQGPHATRAAGLAVGFGKGGQHDHVWNELGRLCEGLDETQVAVVGAAADWLALHKLADVNDQFVQQHHAWRMAGQEIAEDLLAGGCSVGVRFLHERESLRLPKLPGQFTPECANRLFAVLPRLAGCVGGAIEHGDLRLWHIQQTGVIEKGRDAGEFTERTFAGGEMIHREQGVGLAATEGGLELDDRLAALAVETLGNLGEQPPHALGDEGALVEGLGVPVFRGGLAGAHGGEVGGELGLLECAVQHIRVRDDDFSPGFEAHKLQRDIPTTDGTG